MTVSRRNFIRSAGALVGLVAAAPVARVFDMGANVRSAKRPQAVFNMAELSAAVPTPTGIPGGDPAEYGFEWTRDDQVDAAIYAWKARENRLVTTNVDRDTRTITIGAMPASWEPQSETLKLLDA